MECKIHYHSMPDGLSADEKLRLLNQLGSFSSLDSTIGTAEIGNFIIAADEPESVYQIIRPNDHHEWVDQRDEAFEAFLAIGNKETKAGKAESAIFRLYAPGIVTNRDPWMYDFSRANLARKTQAMVEYYEAQLEKFSWGEITYEEAIKPEPKRIKWTRGLRNDLRRKKMSPHSEEYIHVANHRPFTFQNFYYDTFYAEAPGRVLQMYPLPVALSPSSIVHRPSSRGLAETPSQDNPSTSSSASTPQGQQNPTASSPVSSPTYTSSPPEPNVSPDTPTDPSPPTNSSARTASSSLPPPNLCICVNGPGTEARQISAFISDRPPCLDLLNKTQVFVRYRYLPTQQRLPLRKAR